MTLLVKLDEKGRCPVCEIKPLSYKSNRYGPRQKFCHKCHRSYDYDTGLQRANWAFNADGTEKGLLSETQH